MTVLHITVDTEFDRFAPDRDQAVHCRIGGRSHGLGLLLDSFAEFGIRATFFVEAGHTLALGPEPMRPIVESIMAAGHDVELHMHPLWLAEADGCDGKSRVPDEMDELDEATCRRLIAAGQAAFAAWGAPAPIAFRAGGLAMGRTVYRALSACGIPVSSSIGVGIRPAAEPELWIENGRRPIEGVMEVPVLGYADAIWGRRRHHKNLTITGSGTRETIAVLRRASAVGIEDVVLLTHPFELIKRHDEQYIRIEPDRVNQARLRALCAWVRGTDICRTATFRERLPSWMLRRRVEDAPLAAPFGPALARMIENTLNDHCGGLADRASDLVGFLKRAVV